MNENNGCLVAPANRWMSLSLLLAAIVMDLASCREGDDWLGKSWTNGPDCVGPRHTWNMVDSSVDGVTVCLDEVAV